MRGQVRALTTIPTINTAGRSGGVFAVFLEEMRHHNHNACGVVCDAIHAEMRHHNHNVVLSVI